MRIVKRRSALMMSVLAVAYCTVAAAGAAAAAPAHLVPVSKTCNEVLLPSDFQDDLEEVSPPTVIHSSHGLVFSNSTCKYAALTEAGGPPKSFTDGGIGVECLGNALTILSQEKTAPPGGCYRIATVSVSVDAGPQVTKLLPTLRKGVTDRLYPHGYPRHVLRGIGNRAEFGYDGELGYGWVQVLNAHVTIETHGNVSLIQLLRRAASRL